MGDLALAVLFQLVGVHRRAGLGNDPGRDDLAVLGVGQAGHGDLGDRRMPVQELLDLGRIDVLAAANDQLPAPAHDPVIAVVAAAGQVAGMEPAVGVDRPGGRLRDCCNNRPSRNGRGRTARPFRPSEPRRRLAGLDQLDLQPRDRMADRADPDFDRVVDRGERDDRRGLGLAVADADLADAHPAHDLLHQGKGQGAPDMIPVRRLVRSKRAKSGCSSCATYMVGTP